MPQHTKFPGDVIPYALEGIADQMINCGVPHEDAHRWATMARGIPRIAGMMVSWSLDIGDAERRRDHEGRIRSAMQAYL